MGKAVGLIGSVKGKVGATVFANRRGIQVVRAYQPNVAQPKSARQQLSRAKLALATETLRPFNLYLRAGWQKDKPTYEFQQGVRRMIPAESLVITGTSPNSLVVSYPLLAEVFSAGGLQGIDVSEPTSTVENRIDFTVTVPAADFLDEHGGSVECGLVIAVRNEETNEVRVYHEKGLTADTAAAMQITVPFNWAGTHVHVYAFAKQIPTAVNGIPTTDLPWMYPAKTSDCVYVGAVDVA